MTIAPSHEAACVAESGTLLDAMVALDRGSMQIALVVDPGRRLIGILTDGDIRRGLVRGAGLDAPITGFMNRAFASVDGRTTRVEVLELMQARRIHQMPIVDAAGRLVGVHLLHEVVQRDVLSNWAVVMAGGRGTRLGELTRSIPKPMLRVAGRPILERLVLHLVGAGVRRVFLSINYLGHLVEQHFGDGASLGCRIDYLREAEPRGTGGALSLLPAPPSAPLLVMNGDLVTQVDVAAMVRFHEAGEYAATIGTRVYTHDVPFGCIDVEGDRVMRFEEKPTLSRLVNAGIYVLSPTLVARVPATGAFPLPALFEDCLARGERLGAFGVDGDWIDVGRGEQLREARGEMG